MSLKDIEQTFSSRLHLLPEVRYLHRTGFSSYSSFCSLSRQQPHCCGEHLDLPGSPLSLSSSPSLLVASLSRSLSPKLNSVSLETPHGRDFAMQALEQQFLDERPTNVPLFIHTANP
jgi:hypothetical protein